MSAAAPPPLDLDLTVIKKGTAKLLKYRELKREITPLIKIVRAEPVDELEKKLFEDDAATDAELEDGSLITKVQELSASLRPQLEAQEQLVKDLWSQAVSNYTEIEEMRDPSLEMTNGSLDIIDAVSWPGDQLKNAVQKCNELKGIVVDCNAFEWIALRELIRKQNIKKERRQELIVKQTLEIREELVETWGQCMIQSAEDAGFPAFHRTDYTVDLLKLHKEELEKWKAYLAKHQLLFDQIEKRARLWQRMRELQLKSEDPNRFINRGGALLQTQKEQNYVNSALPKCEEKLKAMAKEFEKQNKRRLLIHGMEVAELIKKDWENYRREIKERAAARPSTRPSMRPESSAVRTGERHPVLRETVSNSAEKRRAPRDSSVGPAVSVKKAKSCKNLLPTGLPKRRRSST